MTFVRTEPRYLETMWVVFLPIGKLHLLIVANGSLLPTLAQMDYVEDFWLDLLVHLQSCPREGNHVLPSNWEELVASALRTPYVMRLDVLVAIEHVCPAFRVLKTEPQATARDFRQSNDCMQYARVGSR